MNSQTLETLSRKSDTIIPTQNERKSNAEVSTPYELRNEMLDKIPKEFWTTPKKVFEPCCGKGGFVIDVIRRFMDGLKEYEPNEEFRYKLIVEKCLYFADINRYNVELCCSMINPDGKYDLNYHIGNTLELDINNKWGLI